MYIHFFHGRKTINESHSIDYCLSKFEKPPATGQTHLNLFKDGIS